MLISLVGISQEIYQNEKALINIQNYEQEIIEIETVQYFANDITKNKIIISGTLLTPKTKFNSILIIASGTGKISQNAHNYLTEHLLENNIGVFRFDKKGIGKSTGKHNDLPQPYIDNLKDIINHLKHKESLNSIIIGALGHSLGGIATIGAVEKGANLDFLIQWATPIGKSRELIKYQLKNGIKVYDKNIGGKTIEEKIKILDFVHSVIDKNIDLGTWDIWKATLKESRKEGINRKKFKNYVTLNFVELAKIDNTKAYSKISIPTLIIVGGKDILVDPKQSEEIVNQINNKNIEFKNFKNLNHFMKDKMVSEYSNEIYDIDLSFKTQLTDWINNLEK